MRIFSAVLMSPAGLTSSHARVLEVPGDNLSDPSTSTRLSHFVKKLLHVIRSAGWPVKSFVSNGK